MNILLPRLKSMLCIFRIIVHLFGYKLDRMTLHYMHKHFSALRMFLMVSSTEPYGMLLIY